MTIPKKFSQALPACPAMIKTVSHAPMFSDGATVYLKLFPLSHFTLCEPNILRTKTFSMLNLYGLSPRLTPQQPAKQPRPNHEKSLGFE